MTAAASPSPFLEPDGSVIDPAQHAFAVDRADDATAADRHRYGRKTDSALHAVSVVSAVADLSDGGLVDAIARGDRDALSEAYRRHGSRVHGVASRFCGQSEADDVVQEVFFDLWHTPARFDGERGSLQRFLMLQAHSRAIDSLRGVVARRKRETADHYRQEPSDIEVETAALERLAGETVTRALNALPDRERAAIVLAYCGHHTYREAADMLGIPEGTLKSRIRRGLANLRVQLT